MSTFISHAYTSGKQTATIRHAIWLLDYGDAVRAKKCLQDMLAEVEAEDAENNAKHIAGVQSNKAAE